MPGRSRIIQSIRISKAILKEFQDLAGQIAITAAALWGLYEFVRVMTHQ